MIGYGTEEVRMVSVALIDPPGQIARLEIDPAEIEELRVSIREQGLHQALLLNEKDDRFEIVAGHRRFLAVQGLGWSEVAARCKKLSQADVVVIRATENLQRRDLTPIEEALQYRALINEGGMPIDAVGRLFGKSVGVVQRHIYLLKMPDSFQKALHGRKLAMSAAEELWSCPDAAYREYLLEMGVEHGVTSSVARMWVDDYKKAQRSKLGGDGGGGGLRPVSEPVPIFRACDGCRGPVDWSKVKELRLCPDCFNAIIEGLKG
jgi:ParB/RepB/Spo0J family partition protein